MAGLKYDNVNYVYRKDIQGNIIAILDSNGNIVIEYTYDAWGNCTVLQNNSGIASLNPFRYRGYYWDSEFGLYYLNARYYDPEVGRFISQDSIKYLDPETLNGLNLFAYCLNNPIMDSDPDGTFAISAFLIGALIGFAVSFISSVASQAILNEDHKVNLVTAVIDGAFGAISGALWMVPGLGPVATGFINAGLTFVNGVLTTGIENDWNYTWQDWVSIGISSVLSGVVSGVTRGQFFKDKGKQILKGSHKLAGTIEKRIFKGYYNNGRDVFSKSFRSATKQMFKSLAKLNFSEGFYKDWLITGLQAIFSISFSRGVSGLKW